MSCIQNSKKILVSSDMILSRDFILYNETLFLFRLALLVKKIPNSRLKKMSSKIRFSNLSLKRRTDSRVRQAKSVLGGNYYELVKGNYIYISLGKKEDVVELDSMDVNIRKRFGVCESVKVRIFHNKSLNITIIPIESC